MNENESKHDRFIRVAEYRTNNIIKMIKLLGNCSNNSTYEYTESEVDQIFSAIEEELSKSKSRYFQNKKFNNELFRIKR